MQALLDRNAPIEASLAITNNPNDMIFYLEISVQLRIVRGPL